MIDHAAVKNELGLKYRRAFKDNRVNGFRIKLWLIEPGYCLSAICEEYQNMLPGFELTIRESGRVKFAPDHRNVHIYARKIS